MIYCIECNFELAKGSKFCPACGTKPPSREELRLLESKLSDDNVTLLKLIDVKISKRLSDYNAKQIKSIDAKILKPLSEENMSKIIMIPCFEILKENYYEIFSQNGLINIQQIDWISKKRVENFGAFDDIDRRCYHEVKLSCGKIVAVEHATIIKYMDVKG